MADKKSSPKKETSKDKTYAIVEASGKQFWLQPNRYYDLDRFHAKVDDVLNIVGMIIKDVSQDHNSGQN